MVCSPDGDANFFNIVTRVLQGDTLAPLLLIISLDYLIQTSVDLTRENDFIFQKKEKS